ncbi:hypothetical protein GH714_035349 [Hevea brasiliensis]|uniref:Uncharacterized protein n=1 Tax=Hevea brasiliensis TaxID=3981 RepID=A0A6A6NB39_HEVBR|nr:hypothetical protein GH714_035349 [Hevea brasiliensis]
MNTMLVIALKGRRRLPVVTIRPDFRFGDGFVTGNGPTQYGILLAKKGFKALEWLSIVVLIAVFVYDVNVMKSFDNLNNWREEFLIQISEKKAKAWCASKGNIPYFETSAKEGFNVDAAFKCIAKNALKNEPEEEMLSLK